MSEAKKTILITGAAGFIGSNLVRHWLSQDRGTQIVALDALTYSGSLSTIEDVMDDPRFTFIHGNIRNRDLVRELFERRQPAGVIHLAAESHVDRSIVDPLAFVESNVVGTVVLLQEASRAWKSTGGRFHHVSTDEVFGELGPEGYFNETTPYDPRSPYSASKAAADHFVRAWGNSYGIEYVISNCTNNYGPYQFPEKLIPVILTRALAGERVPIYGEGRNIRDWLFVEDHCQALRLIYETGQGGRTYVVGGGSEVTNLDLAQLLLEVMDQELGRAPGASAELIEFVEDRPGHDFRYAVDTARIERELGWSPSTSLRSGLETTVRWYLANLDWLETVGSEEHRMFQEVWYQGRDGR